MKAKLKSAGMEEVSGLERQIVALEEYRDNAVVVESYYNTRNENIVLEAELAEAQQMSAYFADIKARLDERLRFETERLAEEKRAKAEALLKGILEELKKPKVQESILKKCLVDLGNVKVKPGIQANL